MSRLRRKQGSSTKSSGSAPSKKQKTLDLGFNDDDDHIDSESDEDLQQASSDDDDIEEEETLDEKKVRLARQYLRRLEDDESDESSDDDDDDDEQDEHDRIGVKLQKERLRLEGNLETAVAAKVHDSLSKARSSLESDESSTTTTTTTAEQEAKDWIAAGHIKLLRGHDLTPTCVALQAGGAKAVSGSKDHSVILWDVENECKDVLLNNNWKHGSEEAGSRTQGEILSIACSDDDRYVAVGKRDATVSIFDVRAGKNNVVSEFTGHKGPVTSLAFRMQTLQLFSGSEDRCIRHYNLNEMMYVETLYGHQSGVSDIDCHRKERPISVGRDRTARAWKLAEDTHLIYRGGSKISSADCVSCFKEDWYLTGHDDGHLGLWMTEKKKAVATIDAAHGFLGSVGRGIESVGTLRGSDLAITGSSDGYLRLWNVMAGQTLATRGLEALDKIPLVGFVNGIAIGPKARFCVVASGQEPRLGRWSRIPKAKNRFGIVQLRQTDEDDDEDVSDRPSSENIVDAGSEDDDSASASSSSDSDS